MPTVYLCLSCQQISEKPSLCRKCGEQMTAYLPETEAALNTKTAASIMGMKGGSQTSETKKATSAANGLKGGRPKNLNGGRPKKQKPAD